MFSREEEGASALVGLLLAAFMFSVAFATVIQVSVQHANPVAKAQEAGQSAIAGSLADIILRSPGAGWYSSAATCVNGEENPLAFSPEAVRRMGLGLEACAWPVAGENVGRLSFEKMSDLYTANATSDPANGALDYEDARTSLGLDGTATQFHLRSWPVLPDVTELLQNGQQDPYMKVLYLGNYTGVKAGNPAPPYTLGYVSSNDDLVVFMNVTNDGATSTVFTTYFELDLKRDDMSVTLHSPVVAPGGYGNMSFTIRKTSDWEWKHDDKKWVEVEMSDPTTTLVDTTLSLATVTMTHASERQTQLVEAEKRAFVLASGSVSAKYYYKSFTGKGELEDFADWTGKIVDPGGAVVQTDPLPDEEEGSISRSFTSAGTYQAKLWNDAGTAVWNMDTINVVAVAPEGWGGATSYVADPAVEAETRYIDALMDLFQPNAYSTTYHTALVPYAVGGDVFPDIKASLNDELPLHLLDDAGDATLDEYTTLIVGSNVDHNAMSSGAAKNTIRDWVFAGGTLIVFGSDEQSVTWLQPIFHASLDTVGGGLYAPDVKHPALTTPNELDYAAFDYTTEWGYNSGAEDYFTHVVQALPSGDVLGVGNPGSFGDGRVILSSWRPYDLTADQSTTCPNPMTAGAPCQAMFLIQNLVTLSYRDLYLDYGPPIPETSTVGVQMRVGVVRHPQLEMDVEVRFIVYVF